jgi:hypothetical protein
MNLGIAKQSCKVLDNKAKSLALWKSDPFRLLKTNNAVKITETARLCSLAFDKFTDPSIPFSIRNPNTPPHTRRCLRIGYHGSL